MKRIQIGVISMRDPKTGDFLESEKIFAEKNIENERAYDAMIIGACELLCDHIKSARNM